MKRIEAQAVLSAADRTGGVFAGIASKIRTMNAAAAQANRTAMMGGKVAAANARASSAMGTAAMAGTNAMVMGAARFLAPAAAGYAATKSYKSYAETELAIKRIGITADATDAEIATLTQSLRKLAYDTGKPFQETQEGLESLVTGGMELNKAMQALPAVTRTAQAAGAEVKDMATTTLSLNSALGIQTDKMQSAFDILVAGGKAGKFELKDMARYLPSILPAAEAMGMKGEEGLKKIVSLLQTVRQGTGTTEEAASSVQNIFAKMESEATAEKFEKFGVDLRKEMTKARKEGKDLLQTFIALTDKATKGDLSKLTQLMPDMEFQRGMRAVLAYRDTFKSVMADVQKAAGSGEKDLRRVLNSPAIAVERLSGSFGNLAYAIGNVTEQLGKFFGKKGTSEILTDMASAINRVVEEGPAKTKERMDRSQKNANLINQITGWEGELEAEKKKLAFRQKWLEQQSRGSILGGPKQIDLAKDPEARRHNAEIERLNALIANLKKQKEELYNSFAKPGGFSKMYEQYKDEFVWPMYKSMDDPNRKKDLFNRAPADKRGPVPFPTVTGDKNKFDFGPVTAELTGTAEVKGETTVKVVVEPSSELLRIVNQASATAKLSGQLRANGPGSTGVSSPDAAPRPVPLAPIPRQ